MINMYPHFNGNIFAVMHRQNPGIIPLQRAEDDLVGLGGG
jgi:hypothetical protein